MIKTKYKTVGILGGMGPEATWDLYRRIITIFQKKFDAKYDSDFPPISIYSLPLPDTVENLAPEEEIISMLLEGLKKLEGTGASYIAVPCNSIFSYYNQMKNAIDVPIVNIMEETAKRASKNKFKIVGLLGTKLTIRQKLFEKPLEDRNLKLINPTTNQQVETTRVIMNILSGKKLNEDKTKLISIIKDLQSKGAEAVILGCTELPLLISQKDINLPLIDTTEIIAESVIKYLTNGGGSTDVS